MRARIMLVAALTAPALAGCGGFGFGDKPAPVVAAPTGGAPAPAATAAPSIPVAAAPLPPAGSPAVGAPLPPAAPAAAAAPTQVAAAPAAPPPPPAPTGAALGGVLGGPVGAALTDADRQTAWDAQVAALESGKPRSWRGSNHVYGSIEPGAETGAGCRSYAQTIYVNGRPNHGQGVGCRQPDGGWKMMS